MEALIGPAIGVLTFAVGGLVGWVWALWKAHFTHERIVAEQYVKKSELADALNTMRSANRNLARIAVAVANRLHIPAALDDE